MASKMQRLLHGFAWILFRMTGLSNSRKMAFEGISTVRFATLYVTSENETLRRLVCSGVQVISGV